MQDIPSLHACFLASTGACTDTRQLLAGGMFFALRGPNFDANAFAGAALEQGCRYAVVDDPSVARDERYLVVPDVLRHRLLVTYEAEAEEMRSETILERILAGVPVP